MTVASNPQFIALVPAAGRGERFGAVRPKQYLQLDGKPLLAHTIGALLKAQWITAIHVVIAPDDNFPASDSALIALSRANPARIYWHRVGGPTRQASVAAGLAALASVDSSTWVMVHDAARPGLRQRDLAALRAAIDHGAPGALLAMPVADTIKREVLKQAGQPDGIAVVEQTIDRRGLWQAQTPQVFRVGELRAALAASESFTDESSAMERAGMQPVLVPGSWQNMKITTPQDWHLLAMALAADGAASEKEDGF